MSYAAFAEEVGLHRVWPGRWFATNDRDCNLQERGLTHLVASAPRARAIDTHCLVEHLRAQLVRPDEFYCDTVEFLRRDVLERAVIMSDTTSGPGVLALVIWHVLVPLSDAVDPKQSFVPSFYV